MVRISPVAAGIVGGVALGSAAGIAMERGTRPDPGPTKGSMDDWERLFDRRFGQDISNDTVRNEQLRRDIEDYISNNPLPDRANVERIGGEWTVDRPVPADRSNANLVNALGSLAAGIAGWVLIAKAKPAAPDLAWLVGPKGATLAAPPAAAVAYGSAMLVSAHLLPRGNA